MIGPPIGYPPDIFPFYPEEMSTMPLVIVDEEQQIEQTEPENARILTQGYVVNGGIVVSATLVQALVNRILNNNSIQSGEKSTSPKLLLDMVFANFANKMVKGNWTEVDSLAKQVVVLVAYVIQAIAFDTLAYTMPFPYTQPLPLGQASLVATVNALGYVSAMASAAILSKRTYTLGTQTRGATTALQLNAKRGASGALVAVMASGSAVANRILVDQSSALGIVLNMGTSEIVNKIFKTGQGTESEITNKIKLLFFYGCMAIAADVSIGLILPSTYSYTSPWRYLGGTSIGAGLSFCKVSAKALLDHSRESATASENPESQQGVSKWRMGAAVVSSLAIPLCAIAANHLSVINSSPTLSLACKMVQHNLNALAVSELFKLSTSTIQRIGVSLIPAAVSIGAELIANTVDPKNHGFSVTSVALATAASYLGMTVSGWLLGKTTDDM